MHSSQSTCEPVAAGHAKIESSHYKPDLETEIIETLNQCFSPKWGDTAYWRWKHTLRPGFHPSDVTVFTVDGHQIACFHSALFSLRLARDLDVCASLEGDFGILPAYRRSGLIQHFSRSTAEELIKRGVVLRGGFSSVEKQQRVYERKFGHRVIPTKTANYRKIVGTAALCSKLEQFGQHLCHHYAFKRLLTHRELQVQLTVPTFDSCLITLTSQGARCIAGSTSTADVHIWVPYRLLAEGRKDLFRAIIISIGAALRGRLRTRGAWRLAWRASGSGLLGLLTHTVSLSRFNRRKPQVR